MKLSPKVPAWGALRMIVVCGVTNLGCSGQPQGDISFSSDLPGNSSPDAKKQPLGPLEPGASVLCDLKMWPGGMVEPEIYMLAAINHKLRTYPEFAAESGIDLVSDCDSARRFMTAYRTYFARHPGFDTDEPPGPVREDEPPFPDEPSESPDVQKVFNGTATPNNPVVQVIFAFSPGGHSSFGAFSWQVGQPPRAGSCTGTFIAKNWILTAAHCLSFSAIDGCIKSGRPKSECSPEWDNYDAKYTIRGTRGTGSAEYTLNALARAYVHPNWLGKNRDHNEDTCATPASCHDHVVGDEHDLGLLYIGDDGSLPPKVEQDGAKRLSIVAPSANWAMDSWGWGLDENMTTGTLRVTDPGRRQLFTVRDKMIEGRIPVGNWSFPCAGDSGGPLLRSAVTINGNAVGGGTTPVQAEALVGISASGPVNPTTGGPLCNSMINPTSAGSVWRWTRVDVKENRDWIRETLQRWPLFNKNFQCTPRKIVSGGVEQGSAVMDECWGKPCSADDCATGFSCSRSGREVARSPSSCSACGTGSRDCSCIVGQCLPLGP